jgi:hypothetical protein
MEFGAPNNPQIIVDVQAQFEKRWAPADDSYYREQFHQELAYLIHLIYREAQQPMIEHMAKILTLRPPLIIIKEQK